MAHKTDYRFYIQEYSSPTKDDLEMRFICDYLKFSGIQKSGDIQNVYEESFCEKSGSRVYIPKKSDLASKSYECKLKLLFRGEYPLSLANRFWNELCGTKIEYSDTFRNIYMTLLMTKPMSIENERLYGDDKFVIAEYTFSNIGGQTYSNSQINN